jgi:MFS family permease
LGLVSLFMDISSEIIHSLLPLFLTTTLGVSVTIVGLIDGVSEATASITKVFSGYFSDRIGKRKPLIMSGYALAALSKPLFALATSAPLILGARLADRVGKGVRGAPRDALIADVTPAEIRGRAFGLRQSLDTIGGFAGPLLAVGLMIVFNDDMRRVFWVAFIPALLAVLLVLFAVHDKDGTEAEAKQRPPVTLADIKLFDRPYWGVVITGIVFTLARFSEAFLVLRANAEGLPLALTPLVLVAMNVVFALGAYPAGRLSDSWPARRMLAMGLVVLIAADIMLALVSGLGGVFLGIILWGAHLALTQGLLSKMVADHAPDHLRGSAFGVFNLAIGIAMLFASVIAGLIWTAFGADATFLAGAGFAALALLLIHR